MWTQLIIPYLLLTISTTDDNHVRATIIRELLESTVIDASPIEVDVHGGVATLSGEIINLVTR